MLRATRMTTQSLWRPAAAAALCLGLTNVRLLMEAAHPGTTAWQPRTVAAELILSYAAAFWIRAAWCSVWGRTSRAQARAGLLDAVPAERQPVVAPQVGVGRGQHNPELDGQ